MLVRLQDNTAQEERQYIGEKGPATEPESVTYALTWSFSHTSYGIGHVVQRIRGNGRWRSMTNFVVRVAESLYMLERRSRVRARLLVLFSYCLSS